MKRYILMSFVLIIVSKGIDAQEVYKDKYFVLDSAHNRNKSYHYIAFDSINLKNGFSYEANPYNYMELEVDDLLLIPPTFGEEELHPSDMSMGSGLPYTLPTIVDVNSNGAATVSIPIECPLGINGIQPDLSFVYNSQARDGIMGMGWSIGGMSKISRVPYTYHYAGYTNAVTFTNDDDFSLDGNRLIKGDDGIYYAEVFDNSIINYTNDSFVVNKADGYIYRYGTSDESRYYINGIDKPIEWHLEEIEDAYGNKINFYYHNDIEEGSFYPEKIVCGDKYEIRFEYYDNNRNDTQRKYFSTSASSGFSKITKLLSGISFYYNNEDSWFQKYQLLYDIYDQEFLMYELIAIEKYGSNNNTRAANKYCNSQFVWQNNERIIQRDDVDLEVDVTCSVSERFQDKVVAARFEHEFSSGLSDIVQLLKNKEMPYHNMQAYFNQTQINSSTGACSYLFNHGAVRPDCDNVNSYLAGMEDIILFTPVDINGDCYNEILCACKRNDGIHIGLIYYDKSTNSFMINPDVVPVIGDHNTIYEIYVGDFDGNKCSDLFITNGNGMMMYLSIDGVFNHRKTDVVQFYHDSMEHEIIVGDFNGDGRDQILCLCKNTPNDNCEVYLIKLDKNQNGYIIASNEIIDNEFAKYRFGINGYNKCVHLCTGDFNEDNKQDILVIMRSANDRNWYFYLSEGNGKFADKITCNSIVGGDALVNEDICESCVPVMADYNNDGYTDLGITYVKKDVTIYDPPGQTNYGKKYDLFYRYEYLVRVDDSPKVIKKRIVDDANNEVFVDSVVSNTTGIYYDNALLSCVGNFKGTSSNEVMYVKLSLKKNSNMNVVSKFTNVGRFDTLQYKAISEVINGLGVKTKFDYTRHSYQGQWSDNIRSTGSDAPPQTATYSGSLLVVKDMQRETNQDEYKTSRYFYSKPIFHTRGKGFLGFTNVSKTEETQQDNVKIITSRQFILDTIYFILYPENIKTYTQSGTPDSPTYTDISETSYIYESKKLNAYANMPDKVFYPHQKEIFSKNKYNSTYQKITINEIDAFGNPTQITRRYGNSINNMPYSENNSISYVNKTSPHKILGLVNTKTSIHRNYNSNIPVTYTENYQYDDKGFMTFSKVKGLTTTYTRDGYGNIKTVSASSGDDVRTNSMSYSSDGRLLTKKTNALDHSESYSYFNDKALLKSITDPNGLITTYNYNILDKVESIEYPDGTREEFVRRWVGMNWLNGNSDHPDIPEGDDAVYYTWSKRNGQNEMTIFYDQHERKIRTVVMDINEDKIYTDYIYYDISGLLWKESLPYYKSKGENPQYIVYEYDACNRIKKITRPDGAMLTNSYSGNALTIVNFDGQKKTITYLPAGKPQKINDNESAEIVYEYFGDGNVKSTMINGNDNTKITYTYDANGFPASVNDPSLGKRTYSYNAFGELMSETNADSLTTYYKYDALGRMVERIDEDGVTTWVYDQQKNGMLDHSCYETTDVNAPDVTESYTYDDLCRMVEHKQSFGSGDQDLSFSYNYNDWSLQSSITYPDGFGVSYNYDYNGFVTSVDDKLTNETLWKANNTDRFGNVTDFVLGNNISVNNTYNSISGLMETQSAIDNYQQNCVQNRTYQWDTKGNLTNRTNLITGNHEEFQYDAFNRLAKITTNGTDVCKIIYGNNGNIANKSLVGNMYYGSNNPYAVTKISEVSDISLFSDNQNISYTSFDKLSSMTQGQKSLDIYYGADRQRVYQEMSRAGVESVKRKRYFTSLYEEYSFGNSLKKYHYLTSPSGLFAIFVIDNDTSAMSYVLKDHIGSLYATITNGEVEHYSFDAWGRERNHNTLEYDNVTTTFDRGFCMHEHYRDFGLINMNGRMYDPLVGRMLSPDIVIQDPEYSQSYNRYSYCFNNPLRFTDPSGYVVRGRYDGFNSQYFVRFNPFNSSAGNAFNTDIVEGQPMILEDNYTVDEHGYIKLVEQTDDEFDMLYTKASWDSGEKDDFIKLDKGILDNQYFQCVKNPNDNMEYKYHVLKVRGDNLARNIFEFVSSHSNVEWSRSLVGVNGNMGLNYITTTHLVGTEYGGFHLYVTQLKSYTYRGNDHSHDNNTNTISESDLRFAEMIQKQHPNAKFNIYTPLNGIYTPFDKNSISGLLPEIIIKP